MPGTLPDGSTINDLVDAMYAAISFRPGEMPDWEADRKIFSPDVRFMRLSATTVETFGLDDYVRNVEGLIRSGELPSFHELEISRTQHVFGDIAHIWSTYEGRRSPDDPTLVTRGINSIQCARLEGRWWIVSMIWFREDDAHPIPGEYLPVSK